VAVPESISDEVAILTDPVACSLHSVLRADLSSAARVLVYGPGVLGLGVTACLRAVGFAGQIDVLGRSARWGALARQMGASEFIQAPADRAGRFELIARRTGGTAHRVRLGNRALSGGYDVTFDCVGSALAVGECFKFTRSRGQVVMVGTARGPADLTPIWFKEQTVIGAYGRSVENFGGRRVGTYQLVHEMMSDGRLDVGGLLTHKFRLDDWCRALQTAAWKSQGMAVKVAFDYREGQRLQVRG
jgi:threonine dehydrogenase-like Zn-dependent dehydrogenase